METFGKGQPQIQMLKKVHIFYWLVSKLLQFHEIIYKPK